MQSDNRSSNLILLPDRDRLLPAVARIEIGFHRQFGTDVSHRAIEYFLRQIRGPKSKEKYGNQRRKSQENERDSQRYQSFKTLRLGTFFPGIVKLLLLLLVVLLFVLVLFLLLTLSLNLSFMKHAHRKKSRSCAGRSLSICGVLITGLPSWI